MSELNDFLKLMSEAKAADPKHQKIKEIKESVKADVNNFFQQLAAAAVSPSKIVIDTTIEEQIDKMVEKAEIIEEAEKSIEVLTEIAEEEIAEDVNQAEVLKLLAKQPDATSFQQPNPDTVAQDFKAITNKLKYLEQWVGKISATGPGSGEVNLRWLDDVDRSTISDGRWLKYNEASKKFVFDEINPYEVIFNTTEVTTPTYTVDANEYYIGVNYAGPVTIILPSNPDSGRCLVIKDEDGDAENNPITVQGTVDNDPGGFVLQINNGAIQIIYRNGWRII